MPISSNSYSGGFSDSYNPQGVDAGGNIHYNIAGYAIIPAGSTAASLEIIIPGQAKVDKDKTGIIVPAGALIRQIGFRTLGAVTLGAATGRLKLAPALGTATAGLFIDSAAAAANVLAAMAAPVVQQNAAPVAVGGTALTYRLFATDGGAGAAAAASTVTATKRTKVLILVQFDRFKPFPTEDDVGYSSSDRI